MGEKLLTVPEVADALRVSNMTVYRLYQSGDLAGIRVGRQVRIYERAFQSYLNGNGGSTPDVAAQHQ